MRNIILLVIMLCLSVATTLGQNMVSSPDNDVYRPMLSEGRSWVIVDTYPSAHESYIINMKISGDTIIDGHACKIVVNVSQDTGESYKTVLLEENKIIYLYKEGTKEFLPLMDFNLKVGDSIHGMGQVLSDDLIEVNGVLYRRLCIGSEGYTPAVYWVEGIGSSKDFWLLDFERRIGEYSYMQECYENGECIFTKDDFYKEASGVNTIPSDAGVDDDTIYDLQGRRLRHTVPGINIVNGKKIMIK